MLYEVCFKEELSIALRLNKHGPMTTKKLLNRKLTLLPQLEDLLE